METNQNNGINKIDNLIPKELRDWSIDKALNTQQLSQLSNVPVARINSLRKSNLIPYDTVGKRNVIFYWGVLNKWLQDTDNFDLFFGKEEMEQELSVIKCPVEYALKAVLINGVLTIETIDDPDIIETRLVKACA